MKTIKLKSFYAAILATSLAAGCILCAPAGSLSVQAKSTSSIDKLFAGGKGTKKNPYKIKTLKQLQNIGKNKTTLTKHYVLVNNINAKNKTITNIGNVTMSDMMSGDMSMAFSGTFNGKGHTISNIKVKQESEEVGVGIFECVTGTLKNVTFKNVTSKGTSSSMVAGDVVGYAAGAKVTSVTLKGKNTVCGVNCIGGIVGGGMGATITKCTVSGTTVTVNGDNDFSTGIIEQCDVAECGGLIVGGGFGGTVKNCTAKGTISATGNEPVGLGGIGGCLQCMSIISNNTANVTINAKNGHAIGGLCGYAGVGDDGDGVIDAPATVKNCSVTVKINANGATHVGGLIGTGLYYYGMEDRFNVIDCSVKGTINGATTPGTVAGRATGSTITSCTTSVKVDNAESSEKIGTTSRLYMSGDQYEEGTDKAAEVLLNNLQGSYQGLFETICQDEYYDIWRNYAASVVGESNADATVELLQSSVTYTLYGEEAVEYYANNPDASPMFDCYLQEDLATYTIDGNTITGYDASGAQLFSHEYSYVEYNDGGGMIPMYIYKTDDADAGEFTYFAFASDSPLTTYHSEFRYGSSLDELTTWFDGSYAYWMAAGITLNPSDAMIDNVIRLFVIENLSE